MQDGKLALNDGETTKIERAALMWRRTGSGPTHAAVDVPVYRDQRRRDLVFVVPLAANADATAFVQRGVAIVAEA